MKFSVTYFILVMSSMVGTMVQAQTWDESVAAYQQGDYPTALAGFWKFCDAG